MGLRSGQEAEDAHYKLDVAARNISKRKRKNWLLAVSKKHNFTMAEGGRRSRNKGGTTKLLIACSSFITVAIFEIRISVLLVSYLN